MKNLIEWFTKAQSILKDEKGQTMVEYALLIALIAIVLIGGITAMEGGIAGVFTKITTALGLA